MNNIKKISLTSLFKHLDEIETQITSICSKKQIYSDKLEEHLDMFSFDEKELLLKLLNEKLVIQETIFKRQGGSLENVIFLKEYIKF